MADASLGLVFLVFGIRNAVRGEVDQDCEDLR
jgi:hypothetical protein